MELSIVGGSDIISSAVSIIADPVGEMLGEMCKRRSRAKVMEKILALGLVEDRRDLYKRRKGGRGGAGGRSRRAGARGSDSEDGGGRDQHWPLYLAMMT